MKFTVAEDSDYPEVQPCPGAVREDGYGGVEFTSLDDFVAFIRQAPDESVFISTLQGPPNPNALPMIALERDWVLDSDET